MKTLRETVAAKGYAVGSWINTASPIVAEIMAASGFDYLVIDTEHSAVDTAESLPILQAIGAGNPECFPMVRTASGAYDEIKRYLDAGAMGVIAPLINSPQEAREVARACKYPPEGGRGVGFGRSHGYGFTFDEYMKSANRTICAGIMLEHIRAIERIDEILSVPGIDVAFIGPYDLSASMGITAKFDHQDYIAARRRILEKCAEHGVLPGIHVVQPEPDEAVARVEEGFAVIAYSLDITMLGAGCRQGLSKISSRLSSVRKR